MNDPLATVIMAVYNRERWVARAVESVLSQTYAAFELVAFIDSDDLRYAPSGSERRGR